MIDEKYFVLESLKDLNIIFTNRNYGNVMDMDKNKFIKDFNLEDKIIVSGHQTHSDNIAIIKDKKKTYFEDTDGFITNLHDIAFYTKYADCLPIYMYDEKKNIFSVVHSGWQGSYKEIAKKAINIFINTYNSNKKDIKVLMGISISAEKYEVQQDFYDKFYEKFGKNLCNKSFIFKNNQIFFDNKKFNIENLKEFGIKKENILTNSYCTYKDNFHSYRRDRENSGRNGSFIYLKF